MHAIVQPVSYVESDTVSTRAEYTARHAKHNFGIPLPVHEMGAYCKFSPKLGQTGGNTACMGALMAQGEVTFCAAM